ncbi:hypothetical protein HGA89_00715 [bacterium]|nr:hypothetical protein [bacterium]
MLHANGSRFFQAVVVGLALGLLAGARPAAASPLTPDQVRAAVETWVRSVSAGARPDAVVERLEPFPSEGRPAAYVAHLADGGYCLAGADDRLLPVTLYQPHDPYDPRITDLASILRGIANRLDRIEKAADDDDPELARYADILATRREDWVSLIGGRRPLSYDAAASRALPTALTLPLTATWDQRSPYNDECPILTPGTNERVVVGCVATASLQIMTYWRWPPTLTGGNSSTQYTRHYYLGWLSTTLHTEVEIDDAFSGRLDWDAGNGGMLLMTGYWDDSLHNAAKQLSNTISFQIALDNLWDDMLESTSTYTIYNDNVTVDWSLLGDDHNDPPDGGDFEAADLSYEFAVACDTDFGLWASGSDHEKASAALSDHFRYDPDCHNTTASDYTIIDEIAWLRPVQLAGSEPGSGHSWVVLGYNAAVSPAEFLMNFGWGGTNAWHSRDEVYPDNQSCIVDLAPASVVRFVSSGLVGGDGTPSQPYANIAVAAANAPSGATLIFRAGGDCTFPDAMVTINRPMTLKGVDVTIGPD